MLGSVATHQKCDCEKSYSNKDKHGFICPICNARPTRYVIDARSFKCGLIYSDISGMVLDSFVMAEAILNSMRAAWTISKKPKGKRFDSSIFIPAKANALRFKSIVEIYLKEQAEAVKSDDLEQSTYNTLNQKIRDYLSAFNDIDIRDITKEDLRELYYNLKDKGLADITIKDIFMVLRVLLKRTIQPLDIPEFPRKLNRIIPKKEKGWMDLGMQILVHDKLPVSHNNIYRIGISVMQETGIRKGELLALQKKHFVNGYVIIMKSLSKSGKMRMSRKAGGMVKTKILTPELWRKVQEFLKDRSPDDYFMSFDGSKPINSYWLTRVWKKACEDAKVKYIPLQQSARHSLASQIRADAEEKAIKEITKRLGNTEDVVRGNYMMYDEDKINNQ